MTPHDMDSTRGLTLSGHELNKGLRGMHWNAYYDSPVPPTTVPMVPT